MRIVQASRLGSLTQPNTDIEEGEWLSEGWYPRRKNPENLCKFVGTEKRGGLITVYYRDYAWRIAYAGQFSDERYNSREEAQMAAKELVPTA